MERLSTAVAKERSIEWLGAIALLALIGAQLAGVLNSPPDRDMGHLQKIMYVHVPSAWNAFIAFFVGRHRQPALLMEGQGAVRPGRRVGR
jgi:heme exporter protein C